MTYRTGSGMLVFAALTLGAGCRKADGGSLPADTAHSTSSTSGANTAQPGDYGPAADVRALRAKWRSESSEGDRIVQVVVVQNYGVVEIRNSGPNSPFLALFQKDASGTWQDQGIITGPLAPCGLTAKMIPESVAQQIVAHDTRLAADTQKDPHAGCSGGV